MYKLITKLVVSSLLITPTVFSATIPDGTKLADKQELRLILSSNPVTLDPNLTYDSVSFDVVHQMFQPLVKFDSVINQYVNYGAESYTISDDLKTWTFKLKKDATWSDGKSVTAHDYEYSWKRIINPSVGSTFSSYLSDALNIVNASDILSNKKNFNELGVKALDDYTFQIKTETPVPWLYTAIAFVALSPVREDVINKHGDSWTHPGNIVVNGPFTLKSYVANEKVHLVKNDKFHEANKTIIKDITFNIVGSPLSAYNRYVSGDVDLIEVPRQVFREVKNKGLKLETASDFYLKGVIFNLELDKFKDKRVREAIRLVINNDDIAKKVVQNNSIPTYVWAPVGLKEADKVRIPVIAGEKFSNRVNKAKKLIADAGYTKSNPLKFKLLYSTSEINKLVFVAYQNQIESAFQGAVRVTLENMEWKTFLSKRQSGDFDIAFFSWKADFDNESNYLAVFLSNASINNGKFKSEKYDQLYDKALVTKDPNDRALIFADMSDILYESAAVIPVYQEGINVLIDDKLKGFNVKSVIYRTYSDLYFVK